MDVDCGYGIMDISDVGFHTQCRISNIGFWIPIWGNHWVIHSIGNCIFAITSNYSFAKSCATQVQTSPSLRRVVWVVCVLFTHVFIMYNKPIRLLRAVLHRTKGLLGVIPDFSVGSRIKFNTTFSGPTSRVQCSLTPRWLRMHLALCQLWKASSLPSFGEAILHS